MTANQQRLATVYSFLCGCAILDKQQRKYSAWCQCRFSAKQLRYFNHFTLIGGYRFLFGWVPLSATECADTRRHFCSEDFLNFYTARTISENQIGILNEARQRCIVKPFTYNWICVVFVRYTVDSVKKESLLSTKLRQVKENQYCDSVNSFPSTMSQNIKFNDFFRSCLSASCAFDNKNVGRNHPNGCIYFYLTLTFFLYTLRLGTLNAFIFGSTVTSTINSNARKWIAYQLNHFVLASSFTAKFICEKKEE